VAPVISADRVSRRRPGGERGTACARLFVLGPVRRDAVRPTGTGPLVARDLRWLGELRGEAGASRGDGPPPIDARVRQCAPPVGPIDRGETWRPGTSLVFDKGYTDFGWFAGLTAAGIFFVTRLKRKADYTVSERRTPPQHRGIRCDQIIRFRGPLTRQKYPDQLRRVVARTPEGERLEFLTNHLTLGASTIARIYK